MYEYIHSIYKKILIIHTVTPMIITLTFLNSVLFSKETDDYGYLMPDQSYID